MNKNHILVAYLVPTQLSVFVAKIYGYHAPGCLAVFMDRTTKVFAIHEVPL
jgi:hypothetical protein